MYRHEAIAIARKVMDQAQINEELKPWVVDAILAAVNGTVALPVPQSEDSWDANGSPIQSTEQLTAGNFVYSTGDPDAIKLRENERKLIASLDDLPTVEEMRRCAATLSTDPPSDCDAPFCGCNPEWSRCIEMLQESGWKSPVELQKRKPYAWYLPNPDERFGDRRPLMIQWTSDQPMKEGVPDTAWQPLYAE